MAKDDRLGHAQLCKGVSYHVRLRFRRPHDVAWPITVAEARTVEHDDAVILRDEVDETTGLEILNHTAIAVKKDDGVAFATLDIVQEHAVRFDEPASRRVGALGLLRQISVQDGRRSQDGEGGRGRSDDGWSSGLVASDRERAAKTSG
jgi:hypothetical protein